jgi:hypothetical protein
LATPPKTVTAPVAAPAALVIESNNFLVEDNSAAPATDVREIEVETAVLGILTVETYR